MSIIVCLRSVCRKLWPGAFGLIFGLASVLPGRTQDVRDVIVAKGALYQQSVSGSPVPTSQPDIFRALVDLNRSGALSGASVKLPSGAVESLSADNDQWSFGAGYLSSAGLNGDFPDGGYTVMIQTVHDGAKTIPLSLSGGAFPNAPQLINFSDAQAINPAAPFTVNWNSMAGGSATDYVGFEIQDNRGNTVFETPGIGQPGALNGASPTSVTLPSGTLPQGVSLTGIVTFGRVVQVNSTAYGQGVSAYAGYIAQTQFPMAVAAPPDVTFYVVSKRVSYIQTNDTPALISKPYRFMANADITPGGLSSASIRTPNGLVESFSQDGSDSFAFQADYFMQAAMDGDFPNGSYTFNFNTVHNGARTITLNLAGNRYPNPPRLHNFSALQNLSPTSPYTLAWDRFTTGTTNDFIQVRIEDDFGNSLLESPGAGAPGALNGSSTSFVIPANTFAAGTAYNAVLTFAGVSSADVTSYAPGVIGAAVYLAQTSFRIAFSTGPDVQFYSVSKQINYSQSSPAAPVLSSQPYRFQVSANTASNGLTSASVLTPSGLTESLAANGSDNWGFQTRYLTQTAMDADFPNGTYTVSFNAVHDGSRSIPLKLVGNRYPNPPHLTSFSALQALNPANSLMVTWDAFTNGTPNDYIQFSIQDDSGNDLFASPGYGAPGALDGTATSFMIPDHATQPGRTYQARLLFAALANVDFNDYGRGVVGVAAFVVQLKFPVTTTGSAQGPTLVSVSPADGSQNVSRTSPVVFHFSEPMQQSFGISWSTNVQLNNFSVTWLDNQTISFQYQGALPAASVVGWTLNPTGSPSQFSDLSGAPLATTSGSFATVAAVPPRLSLAPSGPNQWHIHVTCEPGVNYVLENTESIASGQWTPMINFVGSSSGFDFTDGVGHFHNFYRVREGF